MSSLIRPALVVVAAAVVAVVLALAVLKLVVALAVLAALVFALLYAFNFVRAFVSRRRDLHSIAAVRR